MTFRLQGKHLALTYPRADFNIDDGLTFLRNLTTGSRSVKSVIVCSETHEDGSYHRHAYVRFSAKVNISNPRFFDFANFHPNVQACQNVAAWKNYVRMDGNFVEWEDDTDEDDNNIYQAAKRMAEEEYFEYCIKKRIPYGYAERAWQKNSSPVDSITFNEDNNPYIELNLPLPRAIAEYSLSDNLTNVLVGPTGCGKTIYCFRNLKTPFLMISHIDDLRYFCPNRHKAILFDDMKFEHLPLQAQIHFVDRGLPRSIHRRYGTTLIPPGIQVAITCNEIPFMWHPAIARRCNRLLINESF
nr:rep protein [Cressdnaviricota sp.]